MELREPTREEMLSVLNDTRSVAPQDLDAFVEKLSGAIRNLPKKLQEMAVIDIVGKVTVQVCSEMLLPDETAPAEQHFQPISNALLTISSRLMLAKDEAEAEYLASLKKYQEAKGITNAGSDAKGG